MNIFYRMATFLFNPKTDDIRPITDGIKQYRNFGYKFKMSTIGPRNGYWDVNGGILRWLDKEIVLKKLLVTVHKVCHHFYSPSPKVYSEQRFTNCQVLSAQVQSGVRNGFLVLFCSGPSFPFLSVRFKVRTEPDQANRSWIPEMDIFLSEGQFCIFFSKLVTDIDLILFAS